MKLLLKAPCFLLSAAIPDFRFVAHFPRTVEESLKLIHKKHGKRLNSAHFIFQLKIEPSIQPLSHEPDRRKWTPGRILPSCTQKTKGISSALEALDERLAGRSHIPISYRQTPK